MTQQREELKEIDQSYSAIVKRQFKKNRPAVWSLRILYFIVVIGLLADFIANDKPIYCKIDGESYFPIFRDYAVNLGLAKQPQALMKITDWKTVNYESVVRTPIPYSAATTDYSNAQYVGPFEKQRVQSSRYKHLMGTDDIGRDVLSGMIHGTRVAMLVGVLAMSIASIIGIFLGSMAGYYGDTKLKMSRIRIWLNLLFFPIAFFIGFMARSNLVADAFESSVMSGFFQMIWSMVLFFIIMAIPNLLAYPLKRISFLGKKRSIPLDIIVNRLIELLRSIPSLLLILAVVAVLGASLVWVMVIIGIISWTGIARFIRAELLRVRSLEYIEAAEALGFSRARIIWRHAIPNSLTPVLIAIAFGIAAAILTESTLSFLGIGVPPDTITWGKLLSKGRVAPEAWWLAIFPGFAIFITVTIFNLLGDGLADAIDPRLKQ